MATYTMKNEGVLSRFINSIVNAALSNKEDRIERAVRNDPELKKQVQKLGKSTKELADYLKRTSNFSDEDREEFDRKYGKYGI